MLPSFLAQKTCLYLCNVCWQTRNSTGQTNSSDTRSFSQSAHCSIFSSPHQAADSKCYKRKVAVEMLLKTNLSQIPDTLSSLKHLVSFQNVCLTVSLCLNPGEVWQDSAETETFHSAELVFVVLSPDPLRSGQRRRHPLQHHRSRRRSAPEWDLQHRPHQWQHVCHPTPRQRGESLLPCKKGICVFLFPL